MGLIEMRDMYRDNASYTCETCGKKVPFMNEYCEYCGRETPAEYRLQLSIYGFNLSESLREKAYKLNPKLQAQMAEKLKSCKTQAEVNKRAKEILDVIEKRRQEKRAKQ